MKFFWVVKSEKHPAVDSYVRNGVTLRFRHTPRPPLEQAKLKGGEPPAAHSPEAPDTTAYPHPLTDSLVKRPRAYFDLMYGDRAANAWRKAARDVEGTAEAGLRRLLCALATPTRRPPRKVSPNAGVARSRIGAFLPPL
ncbi:hypothetical protein DIPPA_11495 [Diplonema papillatum]|nr:hypothetical protein DIPPA_11495 [Diplonema papillatum]